MKFKSLVVAALLSISSVSFAHDGGHGPKTIDAGKYGGTLSDVRDKSGSAYKGEFVKTSDSKIQLYLYDGAGKAVDVTSWDKTAKVTASSGKKGAEKSKTFELANDGKGFSGAVPTGLGKPYNLVITMSEKGRELTTVISNID